MARHAVLPLPARRMLNRKQALAYCGLPSSDRPPVPPKRVRPGKQGLRYDVLDLDRWANGLDSIDGAEPTDEDLLRGLDDAEDPRPGR